MTIRDVYPCYVANRPEQLNRDLEVTDKYSGEVAARVALADAKTIDRAIQKAVEATGPMTRLPAYARARVLHHCVKRFEERAEELALLLCVSRPESPFRIAGAKSCASSIRFGLPPRKPLE